MSEELEAEDDVFIDDLAILENIIPQCKTQVIEDTGALICLEKPNEFAQAITAFMKA